MSFTAQQINDVIKADLKAKSFNSAPATHDSAMQVVKMDDRQLQIVADIIQQHQTIIDLNAKLLEALGNPAILMETKGEFNAPI
jgi:hypothetical protein